MAPFTQGRGPIGMRGKDIGDAVLVPPEWAMGIGSCKLATSASGLGTDLRSICC